MDVNVRNPHSGVGLEHRMPDRVHEMGFPEPHTTVEEKWVVHERRLVGHRVARGRGKLIVVPYNESLERVTLVQQRRRRGGRGRRLRCAPDRGREFYGGDRGRRRRVGASECKRQRPPQDLLNHIRQKRPVTVSDPLDVKLTRHFNQNLRIRNPDRCRAGEPGAVSLSLKSVPGRIKDP